MARKGWLTIVVLACVTACGIHDSADKSSNSPTPASGPAAAVQSNRFRGEGVVKALNPKGPAIEIDHGDIEGLMPAMQMEFAVTDANMLNGLAVNDRIEFTIENAVDGMTVVDLKKK